MDRLTSMAVFAKCVEAGSLSAAARHFGLSQAMVSKHVRGLEQDLGVRLLSLSTRSLALTEAGAVYHRRCLQILGDIEDANRETMQLQTMPRGVLRLAAPVVFGELHLAPAIGEFLLRYPDVVIDAEFSDRFVNLIEEGYDVAVRVGRLADSSLMARRLGESGMVTCAAPAYIERHGMPAHPRDLAAHRCLSLSSATSPGVWWYEDGGNHLTIGVDGPLKSNSMATLCEAARQGLGIVFGPAFVLAPLIGDGSVTPILTGFAGRSLDIHALYASNRHLTKTVRLFIDFLADRLGGARSEG